MGYKPFVERLEPKPPLEQGDHVLVYQEILVALGFTKWKNLKKGYYGENMWDAVNAFKKVHGWDQDGTIGVKTHSALVAHSTPLQGFRLAMAKAERAGGKNHRIAEAALWYHQAGPYNYSQWRPFHLLSPPLVAYTLDCSGLSITCVYAAFGNAYTKYLKSSENHNGYGNTRSMISEGKGVSESEIIAGDMVHVSTEGYNSHMYVAIDHRIGVSHGHAGFPEIVSHTAYNVCAVRRLV